MCLNPNPPILHISTLYVCIQARKFLPYGFGPGSKTVIEDAASFDDDEEDYGDYQVYDSVAKCPATVIIRNTVQEKF